MLLLIPFLISVLLLSVATCLDVIWTDRGIATKVGVEGNKLIVTLFGVTPSPIKLALFNLVETATVILPSFVGLLLDNVVLTIGGLGIILANAARHYFKGYKAWKKLIG